ncbi:hypothetical protein BC829DRAFT_405229 [Chytridium lagenaria]|nr:hypothetical protein BC829DRAFT_405229 [Chytridium lagenaria]
MGTHPIFGIGEVVMAIIDRLQSMHDFKNLTLTCRQLWAFQNVPMAIKTYMRLKPMGDGPTMSGNLCLRLRQDVAMRLVQELMDQGKASTINIGNLMHKDFWFVGRHLIESKKGFSTKGNGLAKPENALAAAVDGKDIYRARLLSEKYQMRFTAMRVAIGGALGGETVEYIDTVKFLLEHIHDQERPTVEGLASALFEASLLLDFGADPCYWIRNLRDTRHKYGVITESAAGLGNFELVQLLLERGGVVTNGSLKYAIRSGDLNLVNFMLSHGTQMDYKSFMALGQTGSVSMLQRLVPELKKSEWFRLYSSDSESAWNEWLRWMRKSPKPSMLSPEAFEFLRSICTIRLISF